MSSESLHHPVIDSRSPVESTAERRGAPLSLGDFALRTAAVAGIVTLFVALFLLVWYSVDVLLITFAGVLLAVFFHSLCELVRRYTGLNHTLSLGVVLLVLALMAAGMAWIAVPTIAEQASELSKAIPDSLTKLKERVEQWPSGKWLLEHAPDLNKMAPAPEAILSRTASLMTMLFGVFGALGLIGMIFLIGLLLAIQPQLYIDGALRLVAPSRRDRAGQVIHELGEMLKWWLVSKIAAMLVVGGLTWLGLWLLNIELAFTLAVITGLLTFIPNFGPILSTLPPVLLALPDGIGPALSVVALYVGVQLLDSNLVSPYLEYRTVSLPPALTVIAQLTAGALVGAIGLALASPVLAVVMVLVRMLYVEDVLGESLPSLCEGEQNKAK